MTAVERQPMGQRGIALLMVLWTLMLLAMLVVAFTRQTYIERMRTGNVIRAATADAAVQAGVMLGIRTLLNPTRSPAWARDGTPHDLQFNSTRLSIAIQDANGCLDINGADVATLQAVLQAVGVERNTASSLAAAIADWRDPDNLVAPNGAEMQAYAERGSRTKPANRPFLSVGELQGVLGMTPAIYEKLSPLVTVFTGSDEINPMTAPEAMLRAILPKDEVPAILARRSARAAAQASAGEAVPASELGTSDLRAVTDADIVEVAEGPVYVVDVTAHPASGGVARGRAVVWLTQDPKKPYQIVDWLPVSDSPSRSPAQ